MDNESFISASSPEPPPHLHLLPDELLVIIFRLSKKHEHSTVHRPISRRLWPCQRAALLHEVMIYSNRALAAFDRLLDNDVGARELVVEFGLANHDRSTTDVGPAQLAALLGKLPRVQLLRSNDLEEQHIPVFVVPTALASPSGLRSLDHTMCGDWPVANWPAQLGIFDELVELHLEVRSDDAVRHAQAGAPLSRLRKLSLHGPGMSPWAGPPLRDWAPNLVALQLEDYQPFKWFAPMLATAPVGLRKLVVVCEQPEEEPRDEENTAVGALDDELPRFSSLEFLELCRGSFTPDRLLPYLCTLSTLRTLAFAEQSPVTDALLRSLVAEWPTPQRLQRLVLDHVTAPRGTATMWDAVRALQAQGVVVTGKALGAGL
ncbi:hypothetical protein JCM3775_005888 [Rhodotorula graminis]